MARGLIAALQGMTYVPAVDLVSELRSREGVGDVVVQGKILALAAQEYTRILKLPMAQEWQVWVTYHNYYKAPDLLGPQISKALGIPYVLIEASRSPKRLAGPWAGFAAKAEAACDAANSIFYMTDRDRPALQAGLVEGQNLLNLPPFLNCDSLPEITARNIETPVLLSVGMLREGDKLASYTVLADTLRHSKTQWKLHVVGGGPAASKVRALFEPFGDKVVFLGQLSNTQVATQMAHADLFIWPGVNEAFGMVYLEAQSHGLPVVAQNRLGVRDVIGAGGTLVEQDNAIAFAAAIDGLLIDRDSWKLAQTAARDYIETKHLRPAASRLLQQEIQRLLGMQS